MTTSDTKRLLDLLTKIDFPKSYYSLCAKHAKGALTPPVDEQRAAVEETGFAGSKYTAGTNKFWAFREPKLTAPVLELGLNIIITDAGVEPVLVIKTKAGHIGGPFAGLSRDAMDEIDPAFVSTPQYPTPKIKNAAELRTVLAEIAALYSDVQNAILNEKVWSK